MICPSRISSQDSSASSLAGDSGFSPKAIVDLHRFLAAKQVLDEGECEKMSSEEINDLKAAVATNAGCSPRVAMLFKSQQRLKSGVGRWQSWK